ncbi:outer membrane usher protein [Enterobacter sichuanensis]|uniref:outer membrane usher protein n=1 Tax=Enterobacter sichuanensis TaxID=2071710 RepID=UPI0036D295ED
MSFRYALFSLLLCAALNAHAEEHAASSVTGGENNDIEFNDQFLFTTDGNIDVHRFSRGNPVTPGIHRVTLVVNGKTKAVTDVQFTDNGTARATPCIPLKILKQMDVDISHLKIDDNDDTCLDIATLYPGSTVDFDTTSQALNISLPQLFLLKHAAGYIDPSLWDEGIPAGLLSYDMNAWHNQGQQSQRDSAYAGLHYGVNYGPWRLRSNGSLNWDQQSGTRYDNQDIYLQRDITPLKAQMVMGDSWTRGDAFDALHLRGGRLFNDDRMLPGGMSSYAPVIRGTANTNAKITVTQSGNKIYETTVPPGAFEINDLNATGYGQDLTVTIEEADGSQHAFTVPFSSVTQMLRPGYARWEAGVGELQDEALHRSPRLAFGTLYYGLNNLFTGYTGLQDTDMGFSAVLAGIAMNTPLGAFAFDVTRSSAQIDTIPAMKGQSYRLSWNKTVDQTDTSLNVAALRFSTQDYLSLDDAAQLQDHIQYDGQSADEAKQNLQQMKNQLQINLNQPLDINKQNYGSLYINGSWQSWWNGNNQTASYAMGYSNNFRYGSYNVSLQRTYDAFGEADNSLYLNFSIPFDSFLKNKNSLAGFNNVNMGMSSDLRHSHNLNMTANGASQDSRYNYSVTTSYSQSTAENLSQVSAYGSYNSDYGPLSLSASSDSQNSQQYSASYSGGAIIHGGGITFTPGSIGENDALALIKASGAKGAHVSNSRGEISDSGYVVMPYLSAYRENRITLDTSTLTEDVAVENNSTVEVPRNGAVVMVDFKTNEGRSAVLELTRSDSGFIPLGADVMNEKGDIIGSVGQAGQAYVRGVNETGKLTVVWGAGTDETCSVNYHFGTDEQKVGLTTILHNQTCIMQRKH